MASKSEMNILERTRVFFSQVRTEMEKVTWPSRDDVKTYTIVVIVSTIIVSILLGGWDWLLNKIMETVLRLIGS